MQKAIVVDDSRTVRNMLGRILTQNGFTIAEAANGAEGLKAIEEHADVALICADWNMPEMDGLEFVTRLRADERLASVPILMITTETHIERIAQALDAGVNDYLMKPFTPQMLSEKLIYLGLISQD
jgi:two-component system, chemotaxis family, chemotaxis protein CheY